MWGMVQSTETLTNRRVALATLPTPIGVLAIAVADGILLGVDLRGDAARLRADLARRFRGSSIEEAADPGGVASRLKRYFDGELRALDAIEADPGGTPFQRRVWLKLREIPPGRTWSYGELARAVGRPAAVRAVGAANGANPIPLVLPCHRVIGKDGSLTGYGGGLDRKRWLLRHEGATFAGERSLPLLAAMEG
jgi:methylated-DNA-[protein]-cysteine S-methyltransferase